MKTSRTLALVLVMSVAALSLYATSTSVAMFSDVESSSGNIATAGTLDLVATDNGWAPSGVQNALLPGGAAATESIGISNSGTLPLQYAVSTHYAGGDVTLCNELGVVASTSGVQPIHLAVAGSDVVQFIVSLPASASAQAFQGKTCQLALAVDGWQIGLTPTEGFTDHEEVVVTVGTGTWTPTPVSPRDGAVINGTYVEQAWSPVPGATAYVYQSCNNDPDVSGSCDQRWLATYPVGSPEFINTKKSASSVANATYWWRVKTVIGAVEGPWSDAWQITIDNSHQNSVVLNEFLPNPIGNDDALMPGGEWVELYNNKGQDVNVAGWVLYDSNNTHALPITNINTNTHSTLIRSGDFLVVYRNGDDDFSINNDSDTIRLFTAHISTGTLIDSYSYTYPGPGDKPENRSYARVPDGSPTWVDPIPTPGEPNIAGDAEIAPEFGIEETTASASLGIIASGSIDVPIDVASESADTLNTTASESASTITPPQEDIQQEPVPEEAVPVIVEPMPEPEQTIAPQIPVAESAPVVEVAPVVDAQPSE